MLLHKLEFKFDSNSDSSELQVTTYGKYAEFVQSTLDIFLFIWNNNISQGFVDFDIIFVCLKITLYCIKNLIDTVILMQNLL
jgi:hypothetical protein